MGAFLDVLHHAAEFLMTWSDIPGLPSTPMLAADTAAGNKDPSADDVAEAAAKDLIEIAAPGVGTLGGEALKKGQKDIKDYNERKRRKLDDILNSRDGDPETQ